MGGRGFERVKTPNALRGWKMGRGFPPPSQLGDQGEHCKLSQQGPGQSPGRKLISVLSKRHRMPVVETFVIN